MHVRSRSVEGLDAAMYVCTVNTLKAKLNVKYIICLTFPFLTLPAHGRVGRATDCGVRGLGFKSPCSILTFRTETSSISRVVMDGWDPFSVALSG